MHLHLEDQAQRKVEETNDKKSRGFVLLYDNTKQHCVCVGIIKNGKDLWDQAKKRQVGDPGTSPKKKATPQFSGGEGRKRESGILVWNKEGLEFYYTVEKIWREVYKSKEQILALINGWENWEPKDKSKKDAIRT